MKNSLNRILSASLLVLWFIIQMSCKSESNPTTPQNCPDEFNGVIGQWVTNTGSVLQPSGTVTNQQTGDTTIINTGDGSFTLPNPGSGTYTLDFSHSSGTAQASMGFQVNGPCRVQFLLNIASNDGILREKVHYYQNQADLLGVIQSLDTAGGRLTLAAMNQSLSVVFNSSTSYGEQTLYTPKFNVNELQVGQRIAVQGSASGSGTEVTASVITLVEEAENATYREDQGPIQNLGEDWLELHKPNGELIRYYHDDDTDFQGQLSGPQDLQPGLNVKVTGVKRSFRWHALTIEDISATGQPDISLDPDILDFGTLTPGSSSTMTFKVMNVGNADLIIQSLQPPSRPFSLSNDNCSNKTLSPGNQCTVKVRCRPSTANAWTDKVHIPSNDPDEPDVSVTLKCAAQSVPQPDIDVNPMTLNLTPGYFGDITVSNVGTANLNVMGVSLNNSQSFSISRDGCSNTSLAPNSSCTIGIYCLATGTGELTIPSNDPDENPVIVNLVCS